MSFKVNFEYLDVFFEQVYEQVTEQVVFDYCLSPKSNWYYYSRYLISKEHKTKILFCRIFLKNQ